MKKVYLLASTLLLSAASFGQMTSEQNLLKIEGQIDNGRPSLGLSTDRAPGDVIVQDDFSSFTDWAVPADVNGNAWQLVTTYPSIDFYWGMMASTSNANGFAIFDGVSHLVAGTVTAQDALLEYVPVIDCSGLTAIILEFEQRYRAFNTDQVFVEVSGDNGVSWTQWERNVSLAGNGSTIQTVEQIDISSVAAGQAQVKVRFRWQELGADALLGSGYAWAIDDFKLFEAYNYDQEIIGSYFRSGVGLSFPGGLEYYLIPDEQITTIELSGKTQNLGALIQPNAKLTVNISGAGTYTGTSTPADLAPSASDSVATTAPFTPSAIGVYNVEWYFDCDNPEDNTINDTMYDAFAVTDYQYARDNGISQGSIGNVTSNTGQPLTIGNVFNVFADGVVGALDIRITNDTENDGQVMYGQVMIWDNGLTEYVFAGQTADYTVQPGDLGSYVTVTFATPISVAANDDILVLAGHYGGADDLRFATAQGTQEQTVLGYTTGATAPFFLTAPSAVMITADMRSFASVEEDALNGFSIGQNVPNPFDNNSIINYSLEEGANVSVEFVDVSGKVVKSINQGNQTAGSYQINLDGTDFAEGVYFYTFTIGTRQITKRMVVAK